MSADVQPARAGTKMIWAGRVISVLPIAGLLMSAGFKFSQSKDVLDGFEKLGYPATLAVTLGIVELVCTLIYAIPQTAGLGAILLTGYLGGAIATHVRLSEDFTPPVIMAVLVWLGLYLRDAHLRALVPWRK